MKGLFIISILFIFLFSCIKKQKIPNNILDQDQMTLLLWDMIRADEFVYNYVMKDSTLDKKQESIKLYEQVFRLHGTTKEEFEKSLAFYQARPDLLKPVMDSLRNFENKLQTQINPAVD